jgi:hypothetical protein
VAILPRRSRLSDPDLRDRLYELLEHDHLPYSVGSRFVRLIVSIIIIDVLVADAVQAQKGAISPRKKLRRPGRWAATGIDWPAASIGNLSGVSV